MNRPIGRPTPLMVGWTVFVVLAIAIASVYVSGTVLAREYPRSREAAAVGTPATQTEPAADPLDGDPEAVVTPVADPLDGDHSSEDSTDDDPVEDDPLDGPVEREDPDAPQRQDQFEIERSGRPEDAPRSVVAYDDDPETFWRLDGDEEETWLWLDLGEEQTIREVRWLAAGSGTIDVSVSNDREGWDNVEAVEVERVWQGVELRDHARFVRLELIPDDEGELPEIAEVAVYGRDRGGDATLAQEADDDGKAKKRDRQRRERRGRRASRSEQRAERGDSGDRKERRERRNRNRDESNGQTRVSAQEGEATCAGDGERCRARGGDVQMEEDCDSSGTCTIDVNVDGGTALCDATGGSRVKAGDGEGRRGGEGGRCEAVADGGTVAIGDINP